MNTNLISKINQFIKNNGSGEITGAVLNQLLQDMVLQSVTEVTYASLSTMLTNKQIVPGTLYKITDRGDRGIIVTGIAADIISDKGIRIMLCPKTYKTETLDGNVWKGVWHSTKTATVGDLFIWGARVWRNITGAIGEYESERVLDNTNWELIDKTSFTNKEYVEKVMEVRYNLLADWIEWQSIPGQLTAGIPWSIAENNFEQEFLSITDWNDNTAKYLNVEVVLGLFNNVECGAMVNVKSFGIVENYRVGFMSEIYTTQNSYPTNVDVEGIIGSNHCQVITNINKTGSINKIFHPDDWYSDHTDDESFYIECNFSDAEGSGPGPLVVNSHVYMNMILNKGVILTEMIAVGDGLTGDVAAKISIGLETDDETYILPTTLGDLNNGIKISILGNKTTDFFRRFKIAVTDGDVTGGILKISGKYL